MQKHGSQVVLINEFDTNTRFYKFLGIENKVRFFANSYSNSYVMAFFACCREIWDPTKHCNCFASIEEGQKFYAEKRSFEIANAEQEKGKDEEEKDLKEVASTRGAVRAGLPIA